MLEECIDWPLIEAAATPEQQRGAFALTAAARREVCAALMQYVDDLAAQRKALMRRGAASVASAMDPALARRIQQHVSALCRAARLEGAAPMALELAALDVQALDREASGLSQTLNEAAMAARQSAPPATTPADAFFRFVGRLAVVYEGTDGGIDGYRAAGGLTPNEPGFVNFLRALLLDAEEVLLGLPEEPALRGDDDSFAQRVRSALASRVTLGPTA